MRGTSELSRMKTWTQRFARLQKTTNLQGWTMCNPRGPQVLKCSCNSWAKAWLIMDHNSIDLPQDQPDSMESRLKLRIRKQELDFEKQKSVASQNLPIVHEICLHKYAFVCAIFMNKLRICAFPCLLFFSLLYLSLLFLCFLICPFLVFSAVFFLYFTFLHFLSFSFSVFFFLFSCDFRISEVFQLKVCFDYVVMSFSLSVHLSVSLCCLFVCLSVCSSKYIYKNMCIYIYIYIYTWYLVSRSLRLSSLSPRPPGWHHSPLGQHTSVITAALSPVSKKWPTPDPKKNMLDPIQLSKVMILGVLLIRQLCCKALRHLKLCVSELGAQKIPVGNYPHQSSQDLGRPNLGRPTREKVCFDP